MTVTAKICGVNSPHAMAAAIACGAAFVGLVFYPPSPRYISPERAAELVANVPRSVARVGLMVDLDDRAIEAILARAPLDLLQLHGAETPERVRAIKSRFGLPAMKAVKIASADDLGVAERFLGSVDRLLFDAKPPPTMTTALPGGNALAFDWRLLGGKRWPLPWMLSGGLNALNVAEAVRASGASEVDVSSGVEDRPGHKDPAKIARFLEVVRGL